MSGPMALLAGRRWLAGLLLALALAACDSPEQKEAKHLARGIELAETGDDAKAMIEFRNVLRLNPKNGLALYQVGMIHERAERLPQAYRAYEAAVSEQPELIPAQVKLGTMALMGGSLETVEGVADAIETVEPRNADGLALRAAVMLRRGDLERAMTTAGEALAVDPGHENAIAVQVGVLIARQRPDEALAMLDGALARLPASTSLRLLKVAVLEQQQDAAGVVAAFNELVALEPSNAEFRLALANHHQQRNQLGEAESVLRAAVDEGLEQTGTIAALIRLVFQQKGFEGAEAELKRLIGARPDDRSRQLLLADLYLQTEKTAEAEALLTELAAAAPDSDAGDEARIRLAQIRLVAGEDAKATELADAILERSGGHRAANLLKGAVALRANDADEVIRRARTALREDPAWVPALRLLADGHLRKGERDLAIDALNAVNELAPQDTVAAGVLAQLLTERGDLDRAFAIWDRVVAEAADPAGALQARAALAIRQGNWTAAEGDIQRLQASPGQEATAAVLAGNLGLARQRFDESREWFLKAETLRPDASDPVIGVVRAYLGANDADAAIAYLQQRVEQRPEDALAYQLTGELYARKAQTAEAEAAFREAIRLQPKWLTPYRQLGVLLIGADRSDEAATVYEAALQAEPSAAGILLDLGSAHIAGGRIDDAMAAYQRALAVDPKNQIAINNWSALVADYRHAEQAELDRAIELSQSFRASENPFFLDTLGWLYYRKGDFPVALTFIERAGTLGAGGPQFHYHLGMALERGGQAERALAELEKAVVEGADYPGLEEARATLAALREAPATAPAGNG